MDKDFQINHIYDIILINAKVSSITLIIYLVGVLISLSVEFHTTAGVQTDDTIVNTRTL